MLLVKTFNLSRLRAEEVPQYTTGFLNWFRLLAITPHRTVMEAAGSKFTDSLIPSLVLPRLLSLKKLDSYLFHGTQN
jgi:hypothetical protein